MSWREEKKVVNAQEEGLDTTSEPQAAADQQHVCVMLQRLSVSE